MSNATTTAPESGESETLAAAGPPAEVDPRRAWAQALVERARSEGVALTGEDGLLTSMVREVLQAGLDVEMAEHLGYEPYESAGRNSGNSRNGSYPKTVATKTQKTPRSTVDLAKRRLADWRKRGDQKRIARGGRAMHG